jgi:outer membrane protein insertion porin family
VTVIASFYRRSWLLFVMAGLSACGGGAKPPPKEPARPSPEANEVKPEVKPEPIAVHTCWSTKGAVEKDQTARVEIRGRNAPALLCERFPVRPGDPLETATTDSNVRSLYAEGRVEDVVVYKENTKSGVVVVYEVKIRRRVRTVKVRPVAGLEQTVADELVTDVPSWEDTAKFDELVRQATATLQNRGYRRAVISLEMTPEGEDEVNVAFVVDPGPRIAVQTFRVDGFSPERWPQIAPILQTKVGEPFQQELLERDVLLLTADLFDRGNVSATFSTPEIVESPDGAKVDIVIKVTEGPIFKVGQVKFAGDLVAPAATYLREAWKTKSGAVFSRKNVVEDVENVKKFHISRGAPADVDIETAVDQKSSGVNVTVRIKRRQ